MDNNDNVERVCNMLLTNGFDNDVVDVFRENKVDLDVFIQLDKDDIRELGVIALGDRKKLQQLIVKLQNLEKNNEKEADGSSVCFSSQRDLCHPLLVPAAAKLAEILLITAR